MAYVHLQCYTPANYPEKCFHWAGRVLEANPTLLSAKDILLSPVLVRSLSQELHAHLKSKTKQASSTAAMFCGNPWKLFSDDEAEVLRIGRPLPNEAPTNDRRPEMMLQILSHEKAQTEIDEYLSGDCWSVYTRNQCDHAIQKIYYFHNRTNDTVQGDRHSFTSETLLATLDTDPEIEICVSLGCVAFRDLYCRKVSTNQYVIIDVLVL